MPALASRLNSGTTFTREEKLRIRTLYLAKRWATGEIAESVGKDPRAITNLVTKQGWAKERRRMEDKAAAKAEALAVVDATEFIQAVAIRGEESAMRGFDLADGAADARDALAFSAAMSGTKTAVGLTRQALGIDAATQGATVTINAVFGGPVCPANEPRPVEKVAPDAIEARAVSDDLEFA